MKESTVEAALVRAAKAHGVLVKKLGTDGWPDRMLLAASARIVFVELKKPGGRDRPLQPVVQRWLRRRGFRVAKVDTAEDAVAVVEDLVTPFGDASH